MTLSRLLQMQIDFSTLNKQLATSLRKQVEEIRLHTLKHFYPLTFWWVTKGRFKYPDYVSKLFEGIDN